MTDHLTELRGRLRRPHDGATVEDVLDAADALTVLIEAREGCEAINVMALADGKHAAVAICDHLIARIDALGKETQDE